jgi:hypothetical protein
VKDKIYQQYLQAYKKGVFNYIKEEMDAVSQQPMPRKYFSGGLAPDLGIRKILERATTRSPGDDLSPGGNMAMATVEAATSGVTANMSREEAGKDLLTALKNGAVIEANGTGSRVTINIIPEIISAVRGLLAVVNPSVTLREGEITAEEVANIQVQLSKSFGTQVRVAQDGKSLSFETSLPVEKAKQQFDAAMKAPVFDKAFLGLLEVNMALSSFTAEPSTFHTPMGVVWPVMAVVSFVTAIVYFTFNQTTEEVGVDSEFIKHNVRVEPRTDGKTGSLVTLPRPKERPVSDEDWTGLMDALTDALGVDGSNEYAVSKGANEVVITTGASKSEVDSKVADMAMAGKKEVAKIQTGDPLGGIDLNAKNMGLDIAKDGKGIQMKFDPAMVAEFQKGNFAGVEGIILRIVPIQSPLPILGLETVPAQGVLAKG